MDEEEAHPPEAVDKMLQAVEALGFCEKEGLRPPSAKCAYWEMDVTFDVDLPSRVSRRGQTNEGVQAKETVTFIFDNEDHVAAPVPVLRKDFNTDLPHMTPQAEGGPVPCLAMGSNDDLLMYEGGHIGFLSRVGRWLDDAAQDGLCNEEAGWEPIPVFDSELERVVFPSEQVAQILPGGSARFSDVVFEYQREFGTSYVLHLDKKRARQEPEHVWPLLMAVGPEGKLSKWRSVHEVRTLRDLEQVICQQCGKQAKLGPVLTEMRKGRVPADKMLVIVALRRPFVLAGMESNVELIPFLVEGGIEDPTTSQVRVLRHLESVSRDLVKRVTQNDWGGASCSSLVLVGAGSLGSKVGMHLAKGGLPRLTVVDPGTFNPHNGIRHAFSPKLGEKAPFPKAFLLAREAEEFGIDSVERFNLQSVKETDYRQPSTPEWALLLDTTASPALRERCIRDRPRFTRYANSAFHRHGEGAHLYVEGDDSNPRVDDLMAWSMDKALEDRSLGNILFTTGDPALEEVAIGMGCQSMTMPMDDIDASALSAGVARNVEQVMKQGLPKDGLAIWGIKGEEVGSWDWQSHRVGPARCVEPSDQTCHWEVRVLDGPNQEMVARTKDGIPNEVCGAVVGRVDRLNKRIYVTRLIAEPESLDGASTRCDVQLPKLRDRLDKIRRRSNEALSFLGTWHSHPQGGAPSETDVTTLREFAKLMGGPPFLMLIIDGETHELSALVGEQH